MALGEVACRYRADEIRPEDLPMIAAEALAAGLDTPTLCELAGWPRNADAHDIRDTFEQALSEAGIGLPDPGLARRHASPPAGGEARRWRSRSRRRGDGRMVGDGGRDHRGAIIRAADSAVRVLP
ncbi:hypothetical protein [Kitasatospora sp. GAS1066B]|uniref:hypothetical protein n=1 Tax=Kitasatospora sp. GAS1066B TaxID=3156271 RepID=UPI003511B5F7